MKNKIVLSLMGNKKYFDITSLAFHNGKSASSANMVIYSLILTYHPRVIEDIHSIQKKIQLATLYPYPHTPSMEALVNLTFEFRDTGLDETLKDQLQELIKKYKLPDVWELPLTIKILTGILPLPFESSPIRFSYPKRIIEPDNPRIIQKHKDLRSFADSLTDSFGDDFIQTRDRIGNPCIILSGHVKRDNIVKFINQNWKHQIEPILKRLPQRKFNKVTLDRFALGVWAFIRKEIMHRSWKEIDDEIDAIKKNDSLFFGNMSHEANKTSLQKMLDEIKTYFNQIYPL